jgi:hypothetical protein
MSAWDPVLKALAKGEWPPEGSIQKARDSGETWPQPVRDWIKPLLPGIVFDDE